MRRATRSAASWAWRWLVVSAYLLLVLLVVGYAIVLAFERHSGSGGRQVEAGVLFGFACGLAISQLPRWRWRTRGWWWLAVVGVATVCAWFASGFLGAERSPSPMAVNLLAGVLLGAYWWVFWLLDESRPSPLSGEKP